MRKRAAGALIATERYLGEGFDDPLRLNTVKNSVVNYAQGVVEDGQSGAALIEIANRTVS